MRVLALLPVFVWAPSIVSAADWPTFQQNVFRNAVVQDGFAPAVAAALSLDWKWDSADPPRPAWYGPAKWDAYAELRGLKSMRNYDASHHAVAAGELVYFSSTLDDSVHCLYADSGRTKWVRTTDGPLRVPPTIAEGRVYIGSDDGHVYCLDGQEGTLLWKYRPSPAGGKILHDGRLISQWPCRSGVTVADGIAYFTASLLPWSHGYLCAIDAATGEVAGDGHFVREVQGVTMEAPLALSDRHIIVPQGRIPPMLFAREDGKRIGSLQGGGGSFVVVAGDRVFHGPGNKTGWLTNSELDSRDAIATIKNANAIVVDKNRSYVLFSGQLACTDLERKELLWQVASDASSSLIKAGSTLLCGGARTVRAFDAETGAVIWETKVDGTAHGLAVAGGRLLVSTDRGSLYAFSPQDPDSDKAENRAATVTGHDGHAPESATAATTDVVRDERTDTGPAFVGPWLRYTGPGVAGVHWQTKEAVPTVLELAVGGATKRIERSGKRKEHSVVANALPHLGLFRYRVKQSASRFTPWFDGDTLFNYAMRPADQPLGPTAPSTSEQMYQPILDTALDRFGERPSICVLLGLKDGRLADALIRRSNFRVIAFESDGDVIARLREAFLDAGLYGVRFSCHHVDRLDEIPIIDDFANLVSTEDEERWRHNGSKKMHAEAVRLAAPRGTVLLPTAEHGGTNVHPRVSTLSRIPVNDIPWKLAVKRQRTGTGEWTHIYGNAANTLFDGEQLRMASRSDEFRVQWIGRPGPRFQPDRNGRKPPPLVAGGRMFAQGLQRIVALDQYNGTILWALEIPELARFNMPRDCGNWCADENFVYVAVRDRCWLIDSTHGTVLQHLPVVQPWENPTGWEWGYIARSGGVLLGSAVQAGTAATSFWGKEGWYDSEKGQATAKVCSDAVFAFDLKPLDSMETDGAELGPRGSERWRYQAGLIVNSTITAADGRVCFLESRNQQAASESQRALESEALWEDMYLVALDVRSGRKLAERKLDVMPGRVVVYLTYGENTLVLVTSADKTYHVYALAAETLAPRWDASFAWGKGKADHGSHLSRPAIVKDRLYVRPAVFDLNSGAKLPISMPVAGCGTYAATERALFFRAGSGKNSAVWDQVTGDYTNWSRLRPDCWLSTIPAGGMLLSPEGGGGCSCGSWLEASIGFMPAGE